jgi:Na+/citrate or Na+/malate symporter
MPSHCLRNAASSAGFARAILGGGIGRGAEPPSEIHHVKIGGVGADLVAALVMVGGIFLWGGLLVLLAS